MEIVIAQRVAVRCVAWLGLLSAKSIDVLSSSSENTQLCFGIRDIQDGAREEPESLPRARGYRVPRNA